MSSNQVSKNREIPAPDFQILFEGAPGSYLVLAPDAPRYTIVAVSNRYVADTATTREFLLGQGIFEAFPDNPNDPEATGVRNLRASIDRAVATKRADAMAVQKYDIQTPESGPGVFEERHWSPVNTPVIGPDGKVSYVIHRVEDVTEYVKAQQRGLERTAQMEAEILRRGQDLQVANEQLAVLNRELQERMDRLGKANQSVMEMATIPIVAVWKGVLLVPLIGMLDDHRAQRFMERLLSRIAETDSQIAVIDITGVPAIDSQTAMHLIETFKALRFIGAQTVLTGVRPAIAQTLVHLGIDLAGVETRSTLSSGLRFAFEAMDLSVSSNHSTV